MKRARIAEWLIIQRLGNDWGRGIDRTNSSDRRLRGLRPINGMPRFIQKILGVDRGITAIVQRQACPHVRKRTCRQRVDEPSCAPPVTGRWP